MQLLFTLFKRRSILFDQLGVVWKNHNVVTIPFQLSYLARRLHNTLPVLEAQKASEDGPWWLAVRVALDQALVCALNLQSSNKF